MLAKVFNGYIRKQISYDVFQRLANAVDKTFIGDLKKLKEYYVTSADEFKGVSKDILLNLAQSGLVRMESKIFMEGDGIQFHPSDLGQSFITLALS